MGGDVFDRAYDVASRLIKSGHPHGLAVGFAGRPVRDRLVQRLIDHKDLADIFQGNFDGLQQKEFFFGIGARGVIMLANRALRQHYRYGRSVGSITPVPSHKAAKVTKQVIKPKESPKSPVQRREPGTSLMELRNKEPSPIEKSIVLKFKRAEEVSKVEPKQEPVVKKEDAWQIWIHKASDQSFVVAMDMEDLFGMRQPQKSDVKYERIHQCLDRHPDLQGQDLRQGLVYADENRNYPVYDNITLKFAFEQWRNCGPRPNFVFYLEDRTRSGNQPRPLLPVLAHLTEYGDIEHEW